MTKKKKTRNGRDDAICLRLLVIEPKLEFTRIYATTRCSSVVAGFHDLVVSFLELLHSFLLLPGNEQAQLPRVTIDDFLATKHHSPGSLPLRYDPRCLCPPLCKSKLLCRCWSVGSGNLFFTDVEYATPSTLNDCGFPHMGPYRGLRANWLLLPAVGLALELASVLNYISLGSCWMEVNIFVAGFF